MWQGLITASAIFYTIASLQHLTQAAGENCAYTFVAPSWFNATYWNSGLSPEFGFDVGAPEQHSLDAGFSEAIQVSGKAGEDDDDEAVHPSKDAMSREMPSLEEDEESSELGLVNRYGPAGGQVSLESDTTTPSSGPHEPTSATPPGPNVDEDESNSVLTPSTNEQGGQTQSDVTPGTIAPDDEGLREENDVPNEVNTAAPNGAEKTDVPTLSGWTTQQADVADRRPTTEEDEEDFDPQINANYTDENAPGYGAGKGAGWDEQEVEDQIRQEWVYKRRQWKAKY